MPHATASHTLFDSSPGPLDQCGTARALCEQRSRAHLALVRDAALIVPLPPIGLALEGNLQQQLPTYPPSAPGCSARTASRPRFSIRPPESFRRFHGLARSGRLTPAQTTPRRHRRSG
jgi:hypothetical protein